MRNKQKQLQLRDVQDVVDIIGGRWRGAILASLCDKNKRFNDLQRDVGTITSRTLIKELKYLQLNKLVVRLVNTELKGYDFYSLTDHGQSLRPLIYAMVEWGQKHRNEIFGKNL